MSKESAIKLAVIVGVICCALTFLVSSLLFEASLYVGEDSLSVREFLKAEQIIDKEYLQDYDMKEIQYAGLKAMVAKLGDPYSVYYTPEEFEALNRGMSGEYVGLGLLMGLDEETGLAVVKQFYSDSPAEEAGVMVGDFIVGINGYDVTGMSTHDISALCSGEEGTSLEMDVKRDGEILSFEIERKDIKRDMVTYRMLDDGIGYMQIVQFGGNCEELFSKAMDYFKDNEANGVIMDLRDNGGGLMDLVVGMLDLLLPEGTLVYTEDKYGNRETETSDASCIEIPLVVLVNGNTASASEIFAGAVQDYEWGKIVGTNTFGKGIVQKVIEIQSTGGGMKVTVSKYFTPQGRAINGIGIRPDYYVDLQQEFKDHPEDYSFDKDAQVKKAIEVLKESMI